MRGTGGLFVACLLIAAMPAARADTSLRLMTYNVEWLCAQATDSDRDPWGSQAGVDAHLQRVADVIAELRPDICNLIEVINQPALQRLVDALHARGLTAYRGYHLESNDTATEQDLALLTTLEPDAAEGQVLFKLWSPGRGPWRAGYQWFDGRQWRQDDTGLTKHALYSFTVTEHRLGFLGLHLIAGLQDARPNAQRTAQAGLVRKAVREVIAAGGYTPIVWGDFNDQDPDLATPGQRLATRTPVLRQIKDYDETRPGPELVNAAGRIREDGQPPGGAVAESVDHVLLHHSLLPAVEAVRVERHRYNDVSDHPPVVVVLRLP